MVVLAGLQMLGGKIGIWPHCARGVCGECDVFAMLGEGADRNTRKGKNGFIMTTLHIVAIGTGEAHALRAAAEYWRAFVTVTWVGNSGQMVEYFSKSPVHDLIIIAGHGDERGLLLPELAEEIRSQISLQ